MRLGILGGTFNPIHWGHLLLAEQAREQFRLDRVLFIPANSPPHKHSAGLLPGELRIRLIRLAIRGNPAFQVSDIELKRGGVSYSLDTIRKIGKDLPRARLFLLIGADMLECRWRGWKEIRQLSTVVVAGRRPSRRCREAGIRWLKMPELDVASSDIRARIRSGKSIRYLVPEAVERAISRGGLYR